MAKARPPANDKPPAADAADDRGPMTETERLQADNAALRIVMLQAQLELAQRDFLLVQSKINMAHLGYTFDPASGKLVDNAVKRTH